ncbi:cyclic nucleotide-gated ion channel 4 isoform X2 [Malania oleifera]|uniref:cyclic nucleotide-gated ion channel 4 isoform X2 n=1 Tax=Malania oleifera TaxID=397392 RepID=UPI0025AE8FB1|nr:cyclic nucleotide-gated ion channel 4 isoform X2 [Malania oleifera]
MFRFSNYCVRYCTCNFIPTPKNLCIYSLPLNISSKHKTRPVASSLSLSLSLSLRMPSDPQEILYTSRMGDAMDTDSLQAEEEEEEDNDIDGEEEEEEEEERRESSSARLGCKTMYGKYCGLRRGRVWSLCGVLDPRAGWVREWNRVFLLVCATGLFVDPLFFYALSISERCMCLFVDGWFAITVTVLRCMTDALHVWNMWLQLKMAKRSYITGGEGSRLHSTSARAVALRYLKAKGGFFFDLFVILPLPQAAGACWYLLGIQRATQCLRRQCRESAGCGLRTIACQEPIYYGTRSLVRSKAWVAWAHNKQARTACIESSDNFDYGAYKWTVQLVTNNSRLEKVLFPIFWGLMTLSTFGNLESTTEWLEVVFSIIVLTSGLLLVTMLIGNIKVFLHATTSKKQAMQLKMRNIEWWMRKRKLPQGFRHRVRQYERQRWAAMRGVDECQMIRNLPEGLRRDIKYHLCLDLVRQVPLFQHMDDLVLENICDRVKSLIFPKGETITREGDPVQRMLFVVRGHLQSSQVLRDGVKSCCMLGPGNFSGDELLSWCLRRPFIERLPPSSFTLVTLETTEAFGLEAEDVKYVTQHFRYTFVNERVKRSARYYSPGWRTWAAVAIQLAWRRYKHRLTLTSLSFIRPRRPLSRCSSLGEDRLRLYTALLTSPKPNQDDFDF